MRNTIELFKENVLPLVDDGRWFSANQLKGMRIKGISVWDISTMLAYVFHNTKLLERTGWKKIHWEKSGAYCHYAYRSREGYAKLLQKKKEMESYRLSKTGYIQLELPLDLNVSVNDIT